MASEIERLIVTLEASTRQYERALARAQGTTVSAMRKIEGAIAQSEAKQTALFARMGQRAQTAFLSGFKGLGAGLIGGLGISQLANAVGSAVKSVADLGDTAERLGVTSQELQVFNRIAVESGESAEVMARALSEVAEQSQDAESKLTALFAAFGTAPTGNVTRDMQTLMSILQRMQSPMQRAAALADVFGEKLGRRLAEALSQGPEKFIETMDRMRQAGELFTEQQVRDAQQIEARWNVMTDQMGTAFTKAILEATGGWDQFTDAAVAASAAVGNAVAEVMKIVQQLIDLFRSLDRWMKETGIDQWIQKYGPFAQTGIGGIPPAGPGAGPAMRGIQPAGPVAPPGERLGTAFQAFAEKFGREIALGMIATLQGESGQGLYPKSVGDYGSSIGVAQWHNERAGQLKQFAASMGKDWTDFNTQIQFLLHELATSKQNVGQMLAGAKSAEEAVAIMVRFFEIPADVAGEIVKRTQNLGALRKQFPYGAPAGPEAPLGPPAALPQGFDLSGVKTVEDRNAAMQEYADTLDRTALAASNVSAADQAMISAMAAMPEQIQQVNDILANTTDQFAQDLLNGVDAAEALQNALKSLASQLLSMAIQRLFAFGGQQGGLLGALLPGFQHGGSFTVGGKGGTDSNVVAFRATRGEHVTVTPPGHIAGNAQARPSIVFGGTSIVIQGNADERILARMRVMLAENNVRQRRELQRDIGTMNSRWNNMRGIAGSR